MWDLQKTLNHVRGVKRRIAQGKPPYHSTPEENAYWDRRGELVDQGLTLEEINAQTIELRDRAFPLRDWPGHDVADMQGQPEQDR